MFSVLCKNNMATHYLVWVRPQHVADETFLRHFHWSLSWAYLRDCSKY